jgi:hypothetical protein
MVSMYLFPARSIEKVRNFFEIMLSPRVPARDRLSQAASSSRF